MAINEKDTLMQTYFSQRKYRDLKDRLKSYEKDQRKDERLLLSICRSCFYLNGGRIAFQAFTEYRCANCEETHLHPDSLTPKYCPSCAKSYDICADCGSKLDESVVTLDHIY